MLPADTAREVERAVAIRKLQSKVRRLETLEHVGGGDFVLIEEITGASPSFADIPTLYTHLYIIHSALIFGGNPELTILMRFNGDVGNNYDSIRRHWTQVGETTTTSTNASRVLAGQEAQGAFTFSSGWILVPDYLSTIKYKSHVAGGFALLNFYHPAAYGGVWKNTAAINRIDFPGAYTADSVFSLYGIR